MYIIIETHKDWKLYYAILKIENGFNIDYNKNLAKE